MQSLSLMSCFYSVGHDSYATKSAWIRITRFSHSALYLSSEALGCLLVCIPNQLYMHWWETAEHWPLGYNEAVPHAFKITSIPLGFCVASLNATQCLSYLSTWQLLVAQYSCLHLYSIPPSCQMTSSITYQHTSTHSVCRSTPIY